jgi:hypothetical protein
MVGASVEMHLHCPGQRDRVAVGDDPVDEIVAALTRDILGGEATALVRRGASVGQRPVHMRARHGASCAGSTGSTAQRPCFTLKRSRRLAVTGWVAAATTPGDGELTSQQAGLIGGGILGSTLNTFRYPTATPSEQNSTATKTVDPGGSKPVRSHEQAVLSALEPELKAAALKAVPGGTVIRVETDAVDGEWEAHMRKSDGILVTVKFDKNRRSSESKTAGQG